MGLLVTSKKPKNYRVRLKIEDKNLFIKEKTMSIVENKSSFRAACIQLNSYRNAEENIENIVKFFNVAVKNDSDFVTLPEVAGMLEPNTTLLEQKVVYEKEDIILSEIKKKTKQHNVWTLIGSLAIRVAEDRIVNRSFLIDNTGNIVARYDKIHMFDVDLDDGQRYRESDTYHSGTKVVLKDTPWGRLGFSICYDIRFSYLYRKLARNGAEFITIPAAFTRVSGEAHWHVLQRARAIETGSFIISPAQCGKHADGRETYGHSLIIDPWGNILAEGSNEPGVITAEIKLSEVATARRKIPSLLADSENNLELTSI